MLLVSYSREEGTEYERIHRIPPKRITVTNNVLQTATRVFELVRLNATSHDDKSERIRVKSRSDSIGKDSLNLKDLKGFPNMGNTREIAKQAI